MSDDAGPEGAPDQMPEDVPDQLRRLWLGSTPSRRGRKAVLGLDRVLAAATELADREGLSGVTLPRIAMDLGFTTMSLYRHVGSKEELLVLLEDHAIGAPPDIRSAAWREGLTQWACDLRRVYHRRPWLARVPVSGPPTGPHNVAWMDCALGVLAPTRLGWTEKVGALTLLSGYVRHATLLAQDLERGRDGTGRDQVEAERLYARALVRLVEPEKFPHMAELLASDLFETAVATGSQDPAAHHDFTFGLDLILDGVAVEVDRADS